MNVILVFLSKQEILYQATLLRMSSNLIVLSRAMLFWSPLIQYYGEVTMLRIRIKEDSLFYSEFFKFEISILVYSMSIANFLRSDSTHYFEIDSLIQLNHPNNLFLHNSSSMHHILYSRISKLIFWLNKAPDFLRKC